jgi:hypothetical protein
VTTSDLSDEQIELLIADHWREIKGLLAEVRRRKENLPKRKR